MASCEYKQVVCFKCGQQNLAVDIGHVREIIRLVAITSIPDAPEAILGVINLRGVVIPVVDLQAKLRFGRTKRTLSTPIIVVSLAGKQVGLVVDEVREVALLASADIHDVPDTISGLPYLWGVAKVQGGGLIHCLDMEKLLTVNEVVIERRQVGRPWSGSFDAQAQTEERACSTESA